LSLTTKYEESALIALLRQRDQQAFSYLYDSYAGALNNVIYKMVADEKLAEDILQEAFLRIWNNFASYDAGKGRLFTWMLNLTRNLTIDTLRSKGHKNQQKTTGDEFYVSNVADENYPAEQFDSIGIKKQFSKLKPDLQAVIDLGYFKGYTQDEISKTLNIPLGTVKTRMRTAIQELRKLILERQT
jgi:RNA polymerase sigma-70 factor (ECF subfamily)